VKQDITQGDHHIQVQLVNLCAVIIENCTEAGTCVIGILKVARIAATAVPCRIKYET
jgi:hypothetical protein